MNKILVHELFFVPTITSLHLVLSYFTSHLWGETPFNVWLFRARCCFFISLSVPQVHSSCFTLMGEVYYMCIPLHLTKEIMTHHVLKMCCRLFEKTVLGCNENMCWNKKDKKETRCGVHMISSKIIYLWFINLIHLYNHFSGVH